MTMEWICELFLHLELCSMFTCPLKLFHFGQWTEGDTRMNHFCGETSILWVIHWMHKDPQTVVFSFFYIVFFQLYSECSRNITSVHQINAIQFPNDMTLNINIVTNTPYTCSHKLQLCSPRGSAFGSFSDTFSGGNLICEKRQHCFWKSSFQMTTQVARGLK